MVLYQSSVIKKYLKGIESTKVDEAWSRFTSHFHNKAIQENIRNSKEEQYQGEFLIDLFVKVLGYTKNPNPNFNLTTELKNVKGAKKTDGAILQDDKALAVIELKGTKTTDLSKVENQAFGYKNNQPGCVYVITSNFEKLRFYIDNAVDFEEFNLFQITRERFEVLWLCLSSDYLLKNIPKQIKDESLTQEETVTKKLYKDYSLFRNEIFDSIQKNNPDYDKLTLFKKTQKILDRFLFIFFAEDRLLLPPNSIREIINQWTTLRDELDAYVPLYNRFRKYFGYLNTGHKGKKHEIFAYNGGLFAPDDILDNIKIDDTLLYKHTQNLSNYDFETEVSVNILGHIFEHSLNEIEEIQAELEGVETDKGKSKRKKDGVFYTPKYITKYIVDNTVGKLCEEKKNELGIDESEYEKGRKGRKKATLKELVQKLEDYRNWLLELTICDPACGSGAFLNQALEFLINEHRYIDELNAKLLGEAMVLSDIENAILENNLFGVDINEESVEIAKLSLWLRTAQKGRKLTSLNNNIKCGNSLVEDIEIVGDKAFNWQVEFPNIFEHGGFDVIVGNPPYGAKLGEQKKYLEKEFVTYSWRGESYTLFIEQSSNLIKKNGLVSLIVPDTFTNLVFTKPTRDFLLNNSKINEIVRLPRNVFSDAVVDTCILTYQKVRTTLEYEVNIKYHPKGLTLNDVEYSYTEFSIPIQYWVKHESFLINSSVIELDLIDKIESQSFRLKDISEMFYGIKAYQVGKGKPPQTPEIRDSKPFTSSIKQSSDFLPFFEGKHIARYSNVWNNDNFLKYGKWLAEPRIPEKFEDEKILIRKIVGNTLIATYVPETSYCNTLLFVLKLTNHNFKYLPILGIINSKLISWYFKNKNQINEDDTFPQIMIGDILSFPIPNRVEVNSNSISKLLCMKEEMISIKSKMENLIKRRFEKSKLTKKLTNWDELSYSEFIRELKKNKIILKLTEEVEWEEYFISEKEKTDSLKYKMSELDKEIDQLVYDSYGLSEKEILIIESANT